MGYDDEFFRQLEKRNRSVVRRGRTEFVQQAERQRDNNAADPEDFRGTGIVPDAQITRDVQKARQLEQKFGKPGFIASALELVVNQGVDSGYFFTTTGQNDKIESIDTSKYDDYINRVDTAATIHRADGTDLTFAIDLYSGNDPEKAIQKIAQSSNSNGSSIFAGFTEIRYYEDSKGQKRLRNVPRYCIGVDKESIFAAVDAVGDTGNLLQTMDMAEIRFKMLYEMSQQNGLFTNYLYEYSDNFGAQAQGDTDFQQALEAMQTLDNIYLHELEDAKRSLGKAYKDMPIDEIAKAFMKKDDTFKAIVKATERLIEDKENQEEETQPRRARLSGARILEALRRLVPPKPKPNQA